MDIQVILHAAWSRLLSKNRSLCRPVMQSVQRLQLCSSTGHKDCLAPCIALVLVLGPLNECVSRSNTPMKYLRVGSELWLVCTACVACTCSCHLQQSFSTAQHGTAQHSTAHRPRQSFHFMMSTHSMHSAYSMPPLPQYAAM